MNFSRLSLLWKILLPTSLVMTLAFAITGWVVQRDVIRASYASVEEEAKASFQAYESLWSARASRLRLASQLLSTMSDVRAAFGTQDPATIRDTAGELWSRVSDEGFIELADEADHAYASGYVSPRGVRTWGERMQVLVDLGFIKVKPRGNWKYGYVLLLHPHDVVETLAKSKEIPEAWRTQYLHRLQQIGARPGKAVKPTLVHFPAPRSRGARAGAV